MNNAPYVSIVPYLYLLVQLIEKMY